MIDTPDPSPAPEDAAVDAAAQRVARQCAVLAELAEIGLRLARGLERQVEAPAPDPAGAAGGSAAGAAHGDLGLTFDRLARAIRLTLLLQTRIAEGETGRQARAAEARAKAAKAAEAAKWDAWEEAQVEAVIEVVGHTLEVDGQDDETIIARLREARERLDSGDEDYDISEIPTGMVIARICRDFGVTPDWALWAETDWAIEEARERVRGSPYARFGLGGGAADEAAGVDADLTEPAGASP